MVRIDSSWKFEAGNDHCESNRSWAQLSLKKDPKNGDYYVDALFGDRSRKRRKTHLGINCDENQSLKFFEGRGTTQSVTKRMDSKKKGHLYTDRKVLIDAPPKSTLTFKINMDEPTKTIRVLWDETTVEDRI